MSNTYPQYQQSSRLIDATISEPTARPTLPTIAESINRSVTSWGHKRLLSLSRRMWANMGMVKGAIAQRAMYSVERAWNPVFLGEDKAWGEQAAAWLLNEWYGVCDVRGEAYDFKTNLFLDSISVDRDGDYFVLLTETPDGYPQVQRISAHRVTQMGVGSETLKDGQYAGCVLNNGVIFNPQGRAIAYRVQEESMLAMNYGQYGKFTDIPARDCIHVFDPEWYDQSRGFPIFTHGLNELQDMRQSGAWERVAMLLASRLGLVETNETGTLDTGDVANQLAQNRGGQDNVVTEQILAGGETRVLKTGGKLEMIVNDRPGDMWDRFQDRLTRVCLIGANWPYSFVWKSDGQRGPSQRVEVDQARSSVEDRQDLLHRPAKRMCGYAVSKAIKLGILPAYPGKDKGGFLMWGFTHPPKISIDDGRDGESRRRNYAQGFENLTTILAESGKLLEPHIRERAHEVAIMKKTLAEVQVETGQKIEEREMRLITPNEQPDGEDGRGDKVAANPAP